MKKNHTPGLNTKKSCLPRAGSRKRGMAVEKLKMDFSVLLYNLRTDHKLTQKDLAKRIHVRQQYIAKIETGEENLTLETIGKILIALKSMLKINVVKKQGRLTDILQITV